MTPEIKANVTFIKALYENGYDQVSKSAIPFKDRLNYCMSKCPILEVTDSLVLITTNSHPVDNPESISTILNNVLRGMK